MLRRLLLILLLALGGAAEAQTFPAFTGPVVDAANVLPAPVKADLTAKLEALQKDTRRQLVVAIVPDLQGYPIEDYGYRLLRAWGVGLKDVNNGAILIVAPTEHRVRIEVGYGLEPVLTDALSNQIIGETITPRFKAGDVPDGITAGTDALIKQLRASPDEAKARTDAAVAAFDQAHRRANGNRGAPVGLIFWGVVLLFVVLPMLGGRRRWGGTGHGGGNLPIVLWGLSSALGGERRGGWGGGSGWSGGDGGGSDGSWGGGGFTGGGGGLGGGGGASGSW